MIVKNSKTMIQSAAQMCFLSMIIHGVETLSLVDTVTNTICPPGYVHFASRRMCYKVVQHSYANWSHAADECNKDEGRLVVVRDDEVLVFLQKIIRAPMPNIWYWIGVNSKDGNKWIWVDGVVVGSGNWMGGQPDMKNELCVESTLTTGKERWNNLHCSQNRKYICEKYEGKFTNCSNHLKPILRNNKCYWSYSSIMPHSNATSRCENGELITYPNQAFIDFVNSGYFHGVNTNYDYWFDSNNETNQCSIFELLKRSNNILESSPKIMLSNQNGNLNARVICQKNLDVYPMFSCPPLYMIYRNNMGSLSCLRVELNHHQGSWDSATALCKDEGGGIFNFQDIEPGMHFLIPDNYQWLGKQNVRNKTITEKDTGQCSKHYFMCQHAGFVTMELDIRNVLKDKQENIDYIVTKRDNALYEITLGQFSRFNFGTKTSRLFWQLQFLTVSDTLLFQAFDNCSTENISDINGNLHCCEEIYVDLGNYSNTHAFVHWEDCLLPPIEIEPFSNVTVKALHDLTSSSENRAGTKPKQLCPCSCDAPKFDPNPSDKELARIVSKIQQDLKMDKSSTSSNKMKKRSVDDGRAESSSIGYLGICLSSIPFLVIVVFDLIKVIAFIYTLMLGWKCRKRQGKVESDVSNDDKSNA